MRSKFLGEVTTIHSNRQWIQWGKNNYPKEATKTLGDREREILFFLLKPNHLKNNKNGSVDKGIIKNGSVDKISAHKNQNRIQRSKWFTMKRMANFLITSSSEEV